MKPQRAPFQPVTSDIDDDKLERLAEEKGVGSLVKTVTNQSRAGQAVAAQAELPISTPEAAQPDATPRSEMKSLNLEVPLYAWTELKIRAAHKQTSVRHVIMSALRADGITIADADMVEDGRRVRGSNKAD